MSNTTSPKMGPVVATAMSVTVVLGAGVLALPGITYSLAGTLGYLPWVIVAVLMIPLLAIFSFFAKTHPSAGGVVGYLRASLGPLFGASSEMVVLGTFTLGMPGIAMIGAGYLHQYMPSISITLGALGIVSIAFVASIVGLRISGAIQTAIALTIVGGLMGIGIGFLLNAPRHDIGVTTAVLTWDAWPGVAAAIPVVLFAFTGWEMTAFLAEDMHDPKRTMPISIWMSFGIVVVMYCFLAWEIAHVATPDEGWTLAPFVQLAKGWLGELGAKVVAFFATLIVVANVIAAFLSAGRAFFAAGRDGMLPRILGQVDQQQRPIIAIVTTYALFVIVIVSVHWFSFTVETLLQLAGQNFFFLYLLAAIGYTKLNLAHARRWIGYLAIITVSGMLFLFSLPGLLYCLALTSSQVTSSQELDRFTRENSALLR